EHRSDGKWYPFLLRSVDRGAHWSEVTLADSRPPAYAPILVMQDAKRGMMTGMHYAADSGKVVPALLITTDGGSSWLARPRPDPVVRQLLLPGNDKVILTTSNALYVSTDFGQSWQPPHELPPNTTVRGISTHDGSLLWAAAKQSTGTGDTMLDFVYRSDDDGKNWTKIYEGAIKPNFGINAMDFSDANNGIAVGQWGRILRTTDGGFSWTKEYEPYELFDPAIGNVCYPTRHSAVAVTMSVIVTMTGADVLRPPLLTIEQGDSALHRQAHWTAIDGASGYVLQLAEDDRSNAMKHHIFETSKLKRQWQTADTVVLLNDELQTDRDYFVRVRATDDASGSDWSKPVKFSTPEDIHGGTLGAIKLVQPEFGAKNVPVNVNFIWQSVPEATTYDLLVASTPLFADKELYSVYGIADTVSTISVDAGSTYFWSVTAHAPGKKSSGSAYREFSTVGTTYVDRPVTANSVQLQLSPQPAHDRVKVRLAGDRFQGVCQLRDQLGRLVRSIDVTVGRASAGGMVSEFSIDTRDLTSGMYFLILPTSTGMQIGRIIVRK
ncbi:MAG: hypothetical protein KFH87_05355, partial [Bacteroidetes bacterium]|nr:hypothetical protein [Bacteroidota bacterium]